MMEDRINSLIDLKERIEELRSYDQTNAEFIVDEVIANMINEYEENYINYVPEEDSETINIYSYYKRTKKSDGEEEFSMYINNDKYTELPEDTCARSFDILESVANAEGISVRHMTKKELLGINQNGVIGGYKFSINRKDLEKVINHLEVLKKNKTIPRTLLSMHYNKGQI